jgi:uncharacterized protein YciI
LSADALRAQAEAECAIARGTSAPDFACTPSGLDLLVAGKPISGRANPMFVVLLKFADNKGKAGQFMAGHNEWIKRGFDDGVFLLVGSLQPNLGGGIVAHKTSLADLQSRVNADPFVAEKVVKAEILEIAPSRADERLNFLLG